MANYFTTRDHKLAPGESEDWRDMYRREAEEDGYRLVYENKWANFVEGCLRLVLWLLIVGAELAIFTGMVALAMKVID